MAFWNCERCTFINDCTLLNCDMCQHIKGYSATINLKSPSSEHESYIYGEVCGVCNFEYVVSSCQVMCPICKTATSILNNTEENSKKTRRDTAFIDLTAQDDSNFIFNVPEKKQKFVDKFELVYPTGDLSNTEDPTGPQREPVINTIVTGSNSQVSGLVDMIKYKLEIRHQNGITQDFRLCSSPCDHFSQNGVHGAQLFRESQWSCGYRNIQIILSSLRSISKYRKILLEDTGGKIPSIEDIQRLIGAAWHAGFDTEVLVVLIIIKSCCT